MSSTGEQVLRHTTDYLKYFIASIYLMDYNGPIDEHQVEMAGWVFFITSPMRYVYEQRERLKGGKALEFGGGPVLWPSFFLAQYVDTIRFCDYTPQNLAAVSDWLELKSDAHNWSNFFPYIMTKHAQVTGYNQSSSKDLGEWQTRLRDALTQGGLSTCDVNDSKCPVLSGKADEYAIIFSSLCLEAACLTMDVYKETIGRFFRLLKPGGMLLLLVVRNETYYFVGKEKFFCLSLNEVSIREALHEMGFINVHMESQDAMEKDSDMDRLLCVRALKPMPMEQ